jgi:site-specific recombinase XerD
VVILPDECRRKLAWYVHQLRLASGALELTAPLFRSRKGGARLATRSIRDLWRKWQVAAGLERVHPFHALRHTFVTNVYRVSKGDPVVTMVMARHKRIETTQIYIHASDNDMERIAKALPS